MFLRTFGGSFVVTIAALVVAFVYGGTTALAVAAILGVLEISLSFDNAVVNATILRTMNAFWQKIFLTVGVIIAVVGMRLIFPIVIVAITAKLSPARVISLALDKGDVHTPGSYGYLLHDAHPAIAAFGGAFLLMLFLNFIFEERDITWLSWLERPLARIGKLDQLSVVVVLGVIAAAAYVFAPDDKIATVLVSGIFGAMAYILVNGLGGIFESVEESREEDDEFAVAAAADGVPARPGRALALKAGKAAFVSFLYLEVLDASFSFDGVIGAFAITSDPIIIALGLGIGAMFIRSLTVFLVRQGTLDDYVYLEHGAQWAIGALAVLLLVTIKYEVPEVVTGLIGIGFIAAAFVSSLVRNKRQAGSDTDVPETLATIS
jgi:hypothetical protein